MMAMHRECERTQTGVGGELEAEALVIKPDSAAGRLRPTQSGLPRTTGLPTVVQQSQCVRDITESAWGRELPSRNRYSQSVIT